MKLGTVLEHPTRAPLKTRQAIREHFAQRENVTPSDVEHPCWRMLLTGTCPGWLYGADHSQPPGCDHAEMWVRADGSHVLIYQPYSDSFDAGKRRELELWCVARGLTWKEMPELSWHHPNWTTLVLIETVPVP